MILSIYTLSKVANNLNVNKNILQHLRWFNRKYKKFEMNFRNYAITQGTTFDILRLVSGRTTIFINILLLNNMYTMNPRWVWSCHPLAIFKWAPNIPNKAPNAENYFLLFLIKSGKIFFAKVRAKCKWKKFINQASFGRFRAQNVTTGSKPLMTLFTMRL